MREFLLGFWIHFEKVTLAVGFEILERRFLLLHEVQFCGGTIYPPYHCQKERERETAAAAEREKGERSAKKKTGVFMYKHADVNK